MIDRAVVTIVHAGFTLRHEPKGANRCSDAQFFTRTLGGCVEPIKTLPSPPPQPPMNRKKGETAILGKHVDVANKWVVLTRCSITKASCAAFGVTSKIFWVTRTPHTLQSAERATSVLLICNIYASS